MTLRSRGLGAKKANGRTYPRLKSGKAEQRKDIRREGRREGKRVLAVTSCQYSSCRVGRGLRPGDTMRVKIRVQGE